MADPDTDLRKLFELTSDAALIVDERAGRVVAVNEAFAVLTGRDAGTLAGSDVAALLAIEANGDDAEARANLFTGDGQGWIPVRAVRESVHWDGRDASLVIVRRTPTVAESDGDGLGEEEIRALFDYLQEATEQVEVVNRVVAAVNSSRSIGEVFRLASQQMGTLVPFDRASIALCEGDGERLRVFALSGDRAGSLSVGALGQMRGSVTELALGERRMIVIPELERETRFNVYEDLRREGFRSSVCVPLFSTHAAVGSLSLTSCTPAAYNRRHLLALERLAPPLAIAIEKILLLEQTERRSREMEAAARREELAGRIGRLLASSLDPSNVLQETVEMLGRALDASRCHIALFEDEEGRTGARVGYEYVDEDCVRRLRGQALPLNASLYAKKILASEEPVAIDEWSEVETEEMTALYQDLNVHAALAAPVHPGGARGGILELHDCRAARRWTDDDKKLLAAVAAQVSVALTNAELYESARLRADELRGLFEISRTFSTLTETSEISGRLARSIAKLVGGEMCLIATYDRRQNTMRAESSGYNTPPELVGEFHFRLDRENRDAPIYALAESFLSNDPARDSRLNRAFVERYGLTSVLGVPMRIKRELIGFIYVGNRAGGFRERDMRMLEIFSAQAAETIVNARLFLTVQAQAEREAVVNRLLLSLQRGGEPKEKVYSVIERVGQVLDLDRCIIVLFAEGEHEDYYGEWCAEGVEPVTRDVEVRERSPIRYALRMARRPLFAADVREHPLYAGLEDLVERTQLKSLIVVPIMHLGRVIGSISAHQTRRRRAWAEDDIDLLVAVATHVGATLENARLITELREANRLKDEFLATLSHELRTPLTAITGWVDLLSESAAVAGDCDLTDGVSAISASATSLTQLITDLLDLSRIQRGVLRLERGLFDVNLSVTNAVRTVRQAATARRHEIALDLAERLPYTIADAHRIQQVLWNLLTNAIKFTPQGGRITARTRLDEERRKQVGEGETGARGRGIVIEIEDTGEGIATEFLPFIWDRFRQADSSATRRHGGLGIGLALVKELVEAHGGMVEALSMVGKGSTFVIHLPVIEVEQWTGDEPRFERA